MFWISFFLFSLTKYTQNQNTWKSKKKITEQHSKCVNYKKYLHIWLNSTQPKRKRWFLCMIQEVEVDSIKNGYSTQHVPFSFSKQKNEKSCWFVLCFLFPIRLFYKHFTKKQKYFEPNQNKTDTIDREVWLLSATKSSNVLRKPEPGSYHIASYSVLFISEAESQRRQQKKLYFCISFFLS